MVSAKQGKKLRVLLLPFFATSHIGPFTDLAFHLAVARPDLVEATLAVTPANAPVVRSSLARRGAAAAGVSVEVATYAFPAVDGIPPGIENFSSVTAADDAWLINAAVLDEKVMRPGQEALIRDHAPDAIITDFHFFWCPGIAADLGVPCIMFHVIGTFSTLAYTHLDYAGVVAQNDASDSVVTVPGFPSPDIRVPVTELPEFLRTTMQYMFSVSGPTEDPVYFAQKRCLGLAVNTFFDLEHRYCDMYVHNGHAKRTYCVGPLSLPPSPLLVAGASSCVDDSECIHWLDTKPKGSVVYLCFGSLTHVSVAQLREIALGLEASGESFLWVIRATAWTPPEGWKQRVGDRGMVVTGWAPQTEILAHPAVGAFVTHCGWNSVLETIAAGVPVLTWPMVIEQFITERLVTEVLAIGRRLWSEGAGVRSTRSEEHEVVPAGAVAQAVVAFMEPGGPREGATARVKELSKKARAAVKEGGSSHHDLHQLIGDIMEAREVAAAGTVA
ncbi:unnamed protein product [Urochloa humidicola]